MPGTRQPENVKQASFTHTMTYARLLGQKSTLLDALPSFGDGFVDLIFEARKVLLDAQQTDDYTRSPVTDLHQPIFLWRQTARPIARVILVGQKHGKISLNLWRVLLWI